MQITRDLIIYDLSREDLAWLSSACPRDMTQNEFLCGLIRAARIDSLQLSLFDRFAQPQVIHGRIPFKFVDLFAGIGGFRCGMAALGGECVFASEWDKYAVQTYQAWYGTDEISTVDIREINPELVIPDHDILCAGFPCQPFSVAGVSKRNSLGRLHGFEDLDQGNLFFFIMKVVDEKRPPVLMLENVKNLRSHDGGKTWAVIQRGFESRDYAFYERIIDAHAWVPQHRERLFIVCFDSRIFGRGNQSGFEFPDLPPTLWPKLESVLHTQAPDKKYMLSDKLWTYLQNYAAKHRERGNGFGYSCFTAADVGRTLSARYHKDGSEILIRQQGWKNPRRLTPEEAKRLMGFTEKYAKLFGHQDGFPQVVSDTQAYRQYGNAVVPNVVEAVGAKILESMARVFLRTNTGCLIKGRFVEAD